MPDPSFSEDIFPDIQPELPGTAWVLSSAVQQGKRRPSENQEAELGLGVTDFSETQVLGQGLGSRSAGQNSAHTSTSESTAWGETDPFFKEGWKST